MQQQVSEDFGSELVTGHIYQPVMPSPGPGQCSNATDELVPGITSSLNHTLQRPMDLEDYLYKIPMEAMGDLAKEYSELVLGAHCGNTLTAD